MGPRAAEAMQPTATTASQRSNPENPNTSWEIRLASSAMAQNSNDVQPISCTTLMTEAP